MTTTKKSGVVGWSFALRLSRISTAPMKSDQRRGNLLRFAQLNEASRAPAPGPVPLAFSGLLLDSGELAKVENSPD